jgi:hypothetical protein
LEADLLKCLEKLGINHKYLRKIPLDPKTTIPTVSGLKPNIGNKQQEN